MLTIHPLDMPEIVDIPLADLLIDLNNARLKDAQTSQPAALAALATQQSRRLLALASDIVEQGGLDPLSLPAVIPTGDQQKRYVVLEGNRRVAALKALETPSLIAGALDARSRKRLQTLSDRYARDPVHQITCVLFDPDKEQERVNHWINLRHTGPNEGMGLVEWGSDEKDRWAARHGQRSPVRQVLEFLEKNGAEVGGTSGRGGINTNLKRLLNTPEVRERLGIDIADGKVTTWHPPNETVKGLRRVVEDLASKKVRVGDIYTKEQRVAYAKSLPKVAVPRRSTRMKAPVTLDGDTMPEAKPERQPAKGKRRANARLPKERTAVIPSDCVLNIAPHRINRIYGELLTLNADVYPNATSVLLRVFVELSMDHHLEQAKLMTEAQRRSTNLAKRMKDVAADLVRAGLIDAQVEMAAKRVADSPLLLAASVVVFNQYVHNRHIFPKPSELRDTWSELQPLIEAIWP